MVEESKSLERARADIAAGRLWKARDRLHGLLNNRRRDQDALELLGDVYFGMGDLPQAGRFWMLVERDDAEARAARAALEDRYGNAPKELLRQIPLLPPMKEYPEVVRLRLQSLQQRYGEEAYEWPLRQKHACEQNEEAGGFLDTAIPLAFLALFFVPWLLGLTFAVILILRIF